MTDFIFYNEEWNTKVQNSKENFICPIHEILLDSDGFCKKCLEEKNNKNGNKKNICEWR